MDKWYYESDKLIIDRVGGNIKYTIKSDKIKKDKITKVQHKKVKINDKIKQVKHKKIKINDNIDIDKQQINMFDLI